MEERRQEHALELCAVEDRPRLQAQRGGMAPSEVDQAQEEAGLERDEPESDGRQGVDADLGQQLVEEQEDSYLERALSGGRCARHLDYRSEIR